MHQWEDYRIIQIDRGFYTSQLNITVSSDLIGKRVLCARDVGSTIEEIGSSTIIHNTGGM